MRSQRMKQDWTTPFSHFTADLCCHLTSETAWKRIPFSSFSLKPSSDNLSHFNFAFDPPQIMIIYLRWQQFKKLLQSVVELRTLNTVVTNKYATIGSLYQFLFWMSGLWSTEMDVQRRWICAVVTSCSYVRHYVSIKFLQWFLSSLVQNKCLFEFVWVKYSALPCM